MRSWLAMTGGLLVWAAHFLGVYLISSLGDVAATADAPAWRAAALVFSGACLVAEGVVLWLLARRARTADKEGLAPFTIGVGLTGALAGLIGVVWQTAPIVMAG